jgi:hypothetical protein
MQNRCQAQWLSLKKSKAGFDNSKTTISNGPRQTLITIENQHLATVSSVSPRPSSEIGKVAKKTLVRTEKRRETRGVEAFMT